jgi:hypothetical protein
MNDPHVAYRKPQGDVRSLIIETAIARNRTMHLQITKEFGITFSKRAICITRGERQWLHFWGQREIIRCSIWEPI